MIVSRDSQRGFSNPMSEMEKTEHTPTPWEAAERGDYSDLDGESRVILGDDRRIAIVMHSGDAEDEANTNLIIVAVNNYTAFTAREAALREALELALSRVAHRASCHSVRPTSEWPEHGSVSFANCDCEIRTIRAALKTATAA